MPIPPFQPLCRILLLSLLSVAGCLMESGAATPERDVAQRAAMWAARGDVVPCRTLYDSIAALRPEVRDSLLPPHVALFCRLAFARAEGDGSRVAGIADSLETQYENRFDVRGLLALADVRLDALYSGGRWEDLEQYCRNRLQWCARRNIKASRRKVFRQYLAVATENSDKPPVGIHWRSDSFSVPISRDWPLLIPVSAGGGHPLPFMLHSGQRHTLVSEADLREWGIPLPATAPVDIEVGGRMVKACPVVIDSLHIGEMTLSHIPLFVVDKEVEAPYNRSVGTDILRRFPLCVITDDLLTVWRTALPQEAEAICTAATENSGCRTVPMFLTTAGHIAVADGSTASTLVNTALPTLADTDSIGVPCRALPEFKSYGCCALDFENHRMLLAGKREFHPMRVADYIARNDLFALLRNEAALLITATPEEAEAMNRVLGEALTPPPADTLEPALQQALVGAGVPGPGRTAVSILLNTPEGLLFQEQQGQHLLTRQLDASNIGGHRIDLDHMLLY